MTMCARNESKTALMAISLGIVIAMPTTVCRAVEIEGFTEPHRSVDVASAEQGIVSDILVRVGDFVTAGQALATLDDQLHVIMLETAKARQHAQGRLQSASAELRMRQTRYQKLAELHQQGFGRKEEVNRAEADVEIAEAQLQTVRDDLADKHWQYQKIEAELKRRTVRSPLDGVVAAKLKEIGEFVAPNEPNVVTIVELDPLLAKFSMKQSLARHLHIGDEVLVTIEGMREPVPGVVDVVSPVIDAQSGTLKVKVRVANPEGLILSGQRCSIKISLSDEAGKQSDKMVFAQ